MRNLKKVLSLALVLAMAMSLMAGMFTASAFTDDTEIKNKTAVSVMTALKVIQGYTDGSFNPSKVVTRAEMAKMIYVIKNGGNDDGAAYYVGQSTSLTDINGHWAEGYIKYCFTQGIIAGKGDNKFWPDEGVTGLEAAKMALIVIGYNAERSALVGNQWALRTAALGTDAGLFENFTVPFSDACMRDYAALLLFNCVEADTVIWSSDRGDYNKTVIDANTNETVGSRYLKLQDVRGVLTASGNAGYAGGGYRKLSVGGTTFSSVTDNYSDLIGMHVRALYKVDNDSQRVLYGVFKTGNNTVIEAPLSKITKIDKHTSEILVDGKTVKLAYNTEGEKGYDSNNNLIYNNVPMAYTYNSTERLPIFAMGLTTKSLLGKNDTTTGADRQYWAPSSTVRLISNDGDNKIDLAIVVPTFVAKVSNYSGTSFSLSTSTSSDIYSVISVDHDDTDYVVYEGMAKGDVVLVTPAKYSYDDKTYIEKIEFIEGTVTGVRDTTTIRINDTWYSKSNIDNTATFEIPRNDDVAKIAVVGGFYYYYEKVLAGSKDMIYVAGYGTVGTGGGSIKADVIFTKDGTSSEISVSEIQYSDNEANHINKFANFKSNNLDKTYSNMFFNYSESGGKYTLEVATKENTGFDTMITGAKYSRASGADEGKIAEKSISDDAVVILRYADDGQGNYKTKVYTGAAAKKWKAFSGTVVTIPTNGTVSQAGTAFTSKTGGINYIEIAAITTNLEKAPSASGDLKFGIIVGAPYTTTVGGSKSNVYPIYDGNSEGKTVDIIHKTTSALAAKKGDAIRYELIGGDEVENVVKLEGTSLPTAANTAGAALLAIEGYVNNTVQFYKHSSSYSTKDTEIVCFSMKNDTYTAQPGQDPVQAQELFPKTTPATYYVNAAAYIDEEGDLAGLVVSTTQNWKDAPTRQLDMTDAQAVTDALKRVPDTTLATPHLAATRNIISEISALVGAGFDVTITENDSPAVINSTTGAITPDATDDLDVKITVKLTKTGGTANGTKVVYVKVAKQTDADVKAANQADVDAKVAALAGTLAPAAAGNVINDVKTALGAGYDVVIKTNSHKGVATADGAVSTVILDADKTANVVFTISKGTGAQKADADKTIAVTVPVFTDAEAAANVVDIIDNASLTTTISVGDNLNTQLNALISGDYATRGVDFTFAMTADDDTVINRTTGIAAGAGSVDVVITVDVNGATAAAASVSFTVS